MASYGVRVRPGKAEITKLPSFEIGKWVFRMVRRRSEFEMIRRLRDLWLPAQILVVRRSVELIKLLLYCVISGYAREKHPRLA